MEPVRVSKMADVKAYSLIALSVALLASLGFNVQPDATHVCDALGKESFCSSLSSTGVTCYQGKDRTGGKVCTGGKWALKPQIAPTPIPETPKSEECQPTVLAYINDCDTGNLVKKICNGVGSTATCRTTEEILSEIG